MKIPECLGTKVSRETLPELMSRLRGGKVDVIKLTPMQDGNPVGVWCSTIRDEQYIRDAAVKLEKAAALPENCGEVFAAFA